MEGADGYGQNFMRTRGDLRGGGGGGGGKDREGKKRRRKEGHGWAYIGYSSIEREALQPVRVK